MVVGVSEQFDLTLTLKGVGYRATVQGEEIVLSLGYSHPVKMNIQKISVEVVQNTTINLKSCDKALLGLFAANIRGDNLNRIKGKEFYIRVNKFFAKLVSLRNNIVNCFKMIRLIYTSF
jgi:ribosomal protein L6P/L9E